MGKGRPLSSPLTLLRGEKTGHAHALEAQTGTVNEAMTELNGVREDAATMVFEGKSITLPSGGTVVHDEHPAIPLEPGIYTFRRQRHATWRDLLNRYRPVRAVLD